MENNYSTPKNTIVNLSEVPPLDPNNVSNLSSKFKYNEARKASNSTIAQTLNLKVEDASLGKISTRRRKKTKTDRAKESDSKSEGCEKRPKSMLHEICAAKRWKPPLFECCEEGGPSHMKL
ncbi:Double-stranded RNA-binding domain containing protein [Trema orientale]|uniref:Double-stranded RNA-binding domain containing protein n=1 Tax=Trema orientale TaxID=63057 RepID=A0A2P5E635_TREOI|nr:Double-stranded RNA-binding domain containing protein [Trema orientale]